jgi:hypothetical protein
MSTSINDWKRMRYLEQLAKQGGPSMEKTIEMASQECETVKELDTILRTLMDPKTGIVHRMADTAQEALKEGGWMDPQEAAQAVQKALNEGQIELNKATAEKNAVIEAKLIELKAEIGDKSPELLGVLNQMMNLVGE